MDEPSSEFPDDDQALSKGWSLMQVQHHSQPGVAGRKRPKAFHHPREAAQLLFFPLFLLLAALLALPTLLLGLLLWWWSVAAYDRREWWRGLWATAVFGVVVYVVWIWLFDPLPWLLVSFFADVARHLWGQAERIVGLLWLFNLWLAPLVAPILVALVPRHVMRRRLPVPKQATVQEEREEDEETMRQLARFARMTSAMAEPPQQVSIAIGAPALMPVQPQGLLGAYQGGELTELVQGGLFCLSLELLELHGVITGEPRSGKTTTLIRLAAIARAYGRRVMYIDLKGSRKTAALFLAAMAALGVDDARVYPVQAYDGWRGDSQALYNRLMQQIDPASHPFYREGVASAAVSLAVKAPAGPPRNSHQFLERLDLEWLETTYAGDAQALREIKALAPHIGGVALVFAGFFRGINGALDGTWAFEDCNACYIGIDGIAHREEAASLGRFLLDDAAHFAVARKAPEETALLIIDEFGVLESANATGLYEQVREAGLSVYASGQSYQSLGRERDALLAASAIKIVHRSGAPEAFVRYAGEREVFKFSRVIGGQSDEEETLLPTANRPAEEGGSHSIMRPQREYAVPIEDVQQLERGKMAFILAGKGAYVQVQALALPSSIVEAAAQFIRTAPRFTPLPAPKSEDTPANPTNSQSNPVAGNGSVNFFH